MLVKVVLVDVNPKMIAAWRNTFEENPEVEIVQGSLLAQPVSAWVTPTNSRGSMDGGLDGILKKHFGQIIESRVQQEIARLYAGVMPVGHATFVPTGQVQPKYLISTPTMTGSSDDISATMNVALACAAAFQAVHMCNANDPGGIRAVALPGLGANTGKVPVEICADLMWTGYNLFREREFSTFAELRQVLEAELGDLGPMAKQATPAKGNSTTMPLKPAGAPSPPPFVPPPSAKKFDEDFDDAEDED